MSGKRHRPGHTEKMLVHSVKAAYWLADSDAGAVQAARDLAAQMDVLKRSQASQLALMVDHKELAAIAGKIAYVESNLARLLNDLGLTPRGRRDLGFVADESEVNPLDSLRTGTVVELAAVRSPDATDRDGTGTGS